MAKRGQHRESGGQDARSERPATGWGQPLACAARGLACLLFLATSAIASSPTLSVILPRGVQRGGERELEFRGERLADAQEILFHGDDGITAKSLVSGTDGSSFRAVLHVPETCPAGEQLVQVRTASGITEFRSFWVGLLPVVDEAEPNSAPPRRSRTASSPCSRPRTADTSSRFARPRTAVTTPPAIGCTWARFPGRRPCSPPAAGPARS